MRKNTEGLTADELKKMRRMSYIKMAAMVGFVVAIIVFSSIAWFTMNREVEGTGAQMRSANTGFELKVSSGTIGYSSLYDYLPLFSTNNSLITDSSEDGSTIQWRISGNSDTIKPGSQGVLEFTIVENGADASSLHYDLDVLCYAAATSGTGDNITVTGLTEITSTSNAVSQNEKDGADYLKSHLMFFKGRTGANESVWQYSGFIDNINDFTLTPEATATEGEYTAKIYWIWPNTIGQILLNSSKTADHSYLGANAISVMNCEAPTDDSTNDRTKMTAYLNTNVSTMFCGSENYSGLISTLYANRSATPAVSYQTQYDKLSSGYNAADLVIGKNVDYIAVLLKASSD